MAILTRRRDLDRPLNADEFDADIDNLDDRITVLEDVTPEFPIEDITSAGDQLTFELANDTSVTVTMPFRHWNPRIWSPATLYAVDDVFPFAGTLYLVIYPHTSGSVFDAAANDGGGHNYYFAILPNPGNALPSSGDLGMVLMKLSSTSYHVGFDFIDAIYVTFEPSSSSSLNADNVADALEELEGLIASTTGALTFDAIDVTYSPSSASGLTSDNVGDALDELGERVIDFADLSGAISAPQSRQAVVPLGSVSGTVELDPDDGEVFSITASGAITLNASSAPAGARLTLIVTTSGTSSYNITPTTNFKSTGALATGTVSGKTFSVSFVGDGSNLVETCRTVAM